VVGHSHQLAPDEFLAGNQLDPVSEANQGGRQEYCDIAIAIYLAVAARVLAFEVGVDRHL